MSTINPTVLVIDDEEPVREYIRCILEDEGMKVVDSPNGNDAVAIMNANTVDLVITDLVMPEKEGIETIREIMSYNKKCKIIAMSGAVYRDTYLNVTKVLGVHEVISKPFQREVFLELIYKVLNSN